MNFSDTTNRTGLIQDCEDLCTLGATGISGNATRLTSFTRWINEAMSNATGIILGSNERMQWDDTNFTDQPVATTNLVEDQEDYTVFAASPSSNQDWLSVERVEAKDSDGNWRKLVPFDKSELGMAFDEFHDVSGDPIYFDFNGSTVKIKPASDSSIDDALKVWFRRSPDYFTIADTTQKPGFATTLHPYLSIYASYKWGVVNNKENRETLKRDLLEYENRIATQYSYKRDKFEKTRLTRTKRNYR